MLQVHFTTYSIRILEAELHGDEAWGKWQYLDGTAREGALPLKLACLFQEARALGQVQELDLTAVPA